MTYPTRQNKARLALIAIWIESTDPHWREGNQVFASDISPPPPTSYNGRLNAARPVISVHGDGRERRFMSRDEAARSLGTSMNTVRYCIRDHRWCVAADCWFYPADRPKPFPPEWSEKCVAVIYRRRRYPTLESLAKHLRIHRSTVGEWLRSGKIKEAA